ncbi:hypothetical protein [Nonomuraea roseola]|uniref:Uncharacterized protein n=1 Tax=Nonomuraea roseola TaxID=46179 RepID=A0ABV5QDS5_9ACTN
MSPRIRANVPEDAARGPAGEGVTLDAVIPVVHELETALSP